MFLVLTLIVSLCQENDGLKITDLHQTDTSHTRQKKMFSIFSVINFPNSQCTTFSSANTKNIMFGTCQSSSTCISLGGVTDGNCASGFGVCCMISVSSCQATISQNLTYIQNPGFPSSFSTVGTCSYTFNAGSDICQIRLDFDNFVINPPDSATAIPSFGSCTTNDRLVTTSPSGFSPPVLCGTLTGTHMYIETARTTPSSARIDLVLGPSTATSTLTNRTWKIRVQFIECSSLSRPPTDCVQYFTGVSGTFQSYNFAATTPQAIANQNYLYCFRQEEGYCSMNLNQTPGSLFSVGGGKAAKRLVTSCNMAGSYSYLNIRSNVIPFTTAQMTNSNSDVYCGIYFNSLGSSVTSGIASVSSLPFTVGYFVGAAPFAAPSPNVLLTNQFGFSLDYNQVSC